MSTIYRTRNSVYEVDVANDRVRRLEGKNPPTPSQGTDGEWQTYAALSDVGGRLLFVWEGGKATFTSPIVSEEAR